METVHTVKALRERVLAAKLAGKVIGFVPTMGNLHAGHISLVEHIKQKADVIIASIFVNPMQFGANEDLDAYPRTLEADQEKLAAAGTHFLFAPNVSEMYPAGLTSQTVVAVPSLSSKFCGASRPGHFEGVATVVSKLFNMVQPDIAAFGEKDFQQVMVIKQMVADLNMPIEILPVPIARAESGLALSSRNGYLSEEQLTRASGLYAELQHTRALIKETDTPLAEIIQAAHQRLAAKDLEVDFFEVCHCRGLETALERSDDMVILAAVKMGPTRLIDNIVI